ncbi:hypothetical protein D3C73_1137650 [compost metagenome]
MSESRDIKKLSEELREYTKVKDTIGCYQNQAGLKAEYDEYGRITRNEYFAGNSKKHKNADIFKYEDLADGTIKVTHFLEYDMGSSLSICLYNKEYQLLEYSCMGGVFKLEYDEFGRLIKYKNTNNMSISIDYQMLNETITEKKMKKVNFIDAMYYDFYMGFIINNKAHYCFS